MPRSKNKNLELLGAFTGGLALVLFLNRGKFKKSVKTALNTSQNKNYLDTLNPAYKQNFVGFLNALSSKGFSYQITSAFRTPQRSRELKKENKKNASPFLSLHNYGLSIDVIILTPDKKLLDKETSINTWLNSGVVKLAKIYGLDWGGAFKDYADTVHFYVNKDASKLYLLALKQFGSADKIQGNKLVI
jgi:hypothetical protein